MSKLSAALHNDLKLLELLRDELALQFVKLEIHKVILVPSVARGVPSAPHSRTSGLFPPRDSGRCAARTV